MDFYWPCPTFYWPTDQYFSATLHVQPFVFNMSVGPYFFISYMSSFVTVLFWSLLKSVLLASFLFPYCLACFLHALYLHETRYLLELWFVWIIFRDIFLSNVSCQRFISFVLFCVVFSCPCCVVLHSYCLFKNGFVWLVLFCTKFILFYYFF